MTRKKFILNLDQYTGVPAVLFLMLVGALALHSAVGDQTGFFFRQLTWYGIGLVLMLGLSRIDYRTIAHLSFPIYFGLIIMLVAVLLIGQSGGGSQRWLGIGPVRLQPSEMAKFGVIILLAHWCAQRPRPGGARLVELLVPLALLGAICVPIVMQPDLGTTVAITLEGLAILLIAGIHRHVLWGMIGAGLGGAVAAWFFLLQPYQKRRILGFLNPEADPLGIGYHTIQSKIAIGIGGVRGAGFGEGSQTQLQFLPEQHTDFIFGVWAEEWGFFGVCAVLMIYLWLIMWVGRTALEAKDTLGRLLAAGVMVHLLVHTGLNLMMVAGWAPVVGLPLPWMTYGGSAVLVNCMAIGIVFSVRGRRRVYA